MSYIFEDINETNRMLEGSYKKLKSFFYFDKTQLFVKKYMAEFESDRNRFSETFMAISENLSTRNMRYFKALIDQVGFRIMPKKFISTQCISDCINSSVDHKQKISKVNFFIDMPIELYIIDFLWTLLIGKISTEKRNLFRYAAATRFKKSLFNKSTELKTGIDFDSNRSFKPYFGLYSAWRNNAFKVIEKQHKKSDTILLCLDLKSFYYSVEFNFSKIKEFLDDDERLGSFDFLTSVIEEIYFAYTKLIGDYRKGIKGKDKSCVFPIGIMSTTILRELYLHQFDNQITQTLSPLYYSRYVDDMLIVLAEDNAVSFKKEDIIKKYLIDTSIARVSNENDLKLTGYNNIRIQKEKINSFTFLKEQRTVLLDIYAQVINMNSSEANLLPDIDVLNSSFTQNAYNIQNLEISNKIRDLGLLQNNNYNATRFINGLQRIVKNTQIQQHIMDEHFDDVVEFYGGSQSVEFSNNWRSIFELFLLANDKVRARSLFGIIKNEIDYLDFSCLNNDEVYEKKKKCVLRHLKEDLKEKLYIAVALATSLNPDFSISTKIRNWSRIFRTGNMLNHNMVSYPLINYSKLESFPVVGMDMSIISKESGSFELDDFKLKWTPRYINAIEFFIANFLYGFCSKNHLTIDPNIIFNRFVKHNNLGAYLESPFGFSKPSDIPNKTHMAANYLFSIKDNANKNPKIALVNTKIKESDAMSTLNDPTILLTIENKIRLFKILNTAKEENVDIIVFPEFYFPTAWLLDISLFAVKNRISIVTGLQYLTFGERAYNNVCTVIPVVTGNSFLTGFLQFREKNFYAPKEKIELSKYGFSCEDNDIPIYYIVDNGKYRFSTILCYEFTDISSRGSMKSQIEVLFVPQLNKDTNYFSAIVEATTRDLHCFVVQANTSSYGDSRVTAPYKTQYKNILQVKGGDNDVVMISQLDIPGLKKSQSTYLVDLMKSIRACSQCKKIRRKSLNEKARADLCKKCEHALSESYIKGTPPNFGKQ